MANKTCEFCFVLLGNSEEGYTAHLWKYHAIKREPKKVVDYTPLAPEVKAALVAKAEEKFKKHLIFPDGNNYSARFKAANNHQLTGESK